MSENSLKKDEENTEKNITGTSWVTAKAVIGALLVLVLSCLSCLGLSRYVGQADGVGQRPLKPYALLLHRPVDLTEQKGRQVESVVLIW